MSEPEFVFAPIHVTELTEQDDEVVMETPTPVCDFCFDARTRWEYPCWTFTLDTTPLPFGSQGNWLACEACARMIDADDYNGLSSRSRESWLLRYGSLDKTAADSIERIQRGFYDHRNGTKIPWKGDE